MPRISLANATHALVKATGTETEYFELDKVKRKKAETWKLPIESQERRDGKQKAVYNQLMEKGVTAFITDAPKAFNTMLGISHVIASQTVSRVYGDGQKVAYIVVRYDDAIDGASVSKNTYQVNGYEVADAYTSADEMPEDSAASDFTAPAQFPLVVEQNYTSAMHSISTLAFFGSVLMATAERAGKGAVKKVA